MRRISLLLMITIFFCSLSSGCGIRSNSPADTPTIPVQEQPTFSSEYADLELQIKQAFIKTYGENKDISPDDLMIRYYGSGAYAVFVDGGVEYESITGTETIANCEFKYPTTQTLLLFQNNTLSTLSAAAGSLSEDDIKNLHGYYAGHNLYLYKTFCEATTNDSFSGNRILLVINPLYNAKEYTAADFSEVDCVKVKDLLSNVKGTQCCRILTLTIEGDSKEKVLDAIKLLEQREDVFNASPDYILSIE